MASAQDQTHPSPLTVQGSAAHRSQYGMVWRSLKQNPGALVGGALLLLIALSAATAPIIAPASPLAMTIGDRLQGPSLHHLMGTDEFGRDTFSRVLYGGRTTLWLGTLTVAISLIVGGALGMISGFYRSVADVIITRIIDILLAMPNFLLAMVLVFTLGVGNFQVMLAVAISSLPQYARIMRSSVFSAREELYVDAARVVGVPDTKIMFRHIAPNVIAPVLVVATLGLGGSILWIAGLGFLGLGAQPPVVEWGQMLAAARNLLSVAWWLMTFPGLAIMLTVMAVNLLGDGLRDAMDPRLRRR